MDMGGAGGGGVLEGERAAQPNQLSFSFPRVRCQLVRSAGQQEDTEKVGSRSLRAQNVSN